MSLLKTSILRIGSGYINTIEEVIYNIRFTKKIIYISGPIVDKLYGSRIKYQLGLIGEVEEVIVDYNTISYSMELAERIITDDIDLVVGLGGGKVLDVSKYAAFISKRPFLSIPTNIANDGVASPIAVLKKNNNKPKSLGAKSPEMLIIDTDIIAESPLHYIKAGIGDTISNYTALLDWKLACKRKKDEMNGYAYLMSKTSLNALLNANQKEIDAKFIKLLANSLVLSGIAMDFAGTSRPVSGSEHLFSHALDFYSPKKNLHGIQVALGTVAVLKLMGLPYDEVLNYLRRFEVEINPLALQIEEKVFVQCMQMAPGMRSNRYTFLHEADLNNKNLEKIYKELTEEL